MVHGDHPLLQRQAWDEERLERREGRRWRPTCRTHRQAHWYIPMHSMSHNWIRSNIRPGGSPWSGRRYRPPMPSAHYDTREAGRDARLETRSVRSGLGRPDHYEGSVKGRESGRRDDYDGRHTQTGPDVDLQSLPWERPDDAPRFCCEYQCIKQTIFLF